MVLVPYLPPRPLPFGPLSMLLLRNSREYVTDPGPAALSTAGGLWISYFFGFPVLTCHEQTALGAEES